MSPRKEHTIPKNGLSYSMIERSVLRKPTKKKTGVVKNNKHQGKLDLGLRRNRK